MATMSANAPSDAISPDAKVRVTVEAANQPTSVTSKIGSEEKSESKMDAAQSSLKQILSSLAETRKYLPNQVYTFLDSMEGKTIDDLRMEAMNLASKAQEEAKKRTGDVKNLVGNANQKVQDAADMARAKTTGIASDIANKGKDLVQPPLEATRDATKSVAMRSLEATQGLAMKGLEKSTNLAMQGFTMASTRLMPIVQPVVQPVASRAIEYLPAPAKTFVHENIEGKSLDELRDKALLATRKNLLSVKDETKPATLSGLVGEVKEAAVSGTLLNNALTLSEKAANNAFGETETPADTAAWRRLYNLATKVTGGVKNYTTSQWNNLNAQWRLMASTRADQMKGMVLYRVDMLRSNISPILERIGATPVIPSFVYKLLRGEVSPPQQMSSASSTEKSTTDTSKATSATVPTTTVKVDIVGTKPFQAGNPADAKTASFGGTTTSIPLKEMNKSSEPIGNTNAQGMGELGSAGMGVTTTGSEDKSASEGEEQKNKKKKHNKA